MLILLPVKNAQLELFRGLLPLIRLTLITRAPLAGEVWKNGNAVPVVLHVGAFHAPNAELKAVIKVEGTPTGTSWILSYPTLVPAARELAMQEASTVGASRSDIRPPRQSSTTSARRLMAWRPVSGWTSGGSRRAHLPPSTVTAGPSHHPA